MIFDCDLTNVQNIQNYYTINRYLTFVDGLNESVDQY